MAVHTSQSVPEPIVATTHQAPSSTIWSKTVTAACAVASRPAYVDAPGTVVLDTTRHSGLHVLRMTAIPTSPTLGSGGGPVIGTAVLPPIVTAPAHTISTDIPSQVEVRVGASARYTTGDTTFNTV